MQHIDEFKSKYAQWVKSSQNNSMYCISYSYIKFRKCNLWQKADGKGVRKNREGGIMKGEE